MQLPSSSRIKQMGRGVGTTVGVANDAAGTSSTVAKTVGTAAAVAVGPVVAVGVVVAKGPTAVTVLDEPERAKSTNNSATSMSAANTESPPTNAAYGVTARRRRLLLTRFKIGPRPRFVTMMQAISTKWPRG